MVKNNQELISKLISDGVLKTLSLINAFRVCDRGLFVPENYDKQAYHDEPLPIGYGQTISQPTTVAIMLELLDVLPGQHVLDIGSGSGWTAALLSFIVGSKGTVTGVEIIPELAEWGMKNIHKLSTQNTRIIHASSNVLGTPGKHYDRILVSASAHDIPDQLLDQLSINGILVIPIGDTLYKIVKNDDGSYLKYALEGFRFVPLIY